MRSSIVESQPPPVQVPPCRCQFAPVTRTRTPPDSTGGTPLSSCACALDRSESFPPGRGSLALRRSADCNRDLGEISLARVFRQNHRTHKEKHSASSSGASAASAHLRPVPVLTSAKDLDLSSAGRCAHHPAVS